MLILIQSIFLGNCSLVDDIVMTRFSFNAKFQQKCNQNLIRALKGKKISDILFNFKAFSEEIVAKVLFKR